MNSTSHTPNARCARSLAGAIIIHRPVAVIIKAGSLVLFSTIWSITDNDSRSWGDCNLPHSLLPTTSSPSTNFYAISDDIYFNERKVCHFLLSNNNETSKGKSILCEMKKDVGMITAQKSKETRRMEDGNGINLCSAYPANNPYIYVG